MKPLKTLFFLSFLIILSSCTEKDTAAIQNCKEIIDLLKTDLNLTIDFTQKTNILIDVNNDGVDDFIFTTQIAGNGFFRVIKPLNNQNKIASTQILDLGTPINNKLTFTDKFKFGTIQNGFGNNYGTLTNKFIGFKIVLDENEHFGWFRFSSTDSSPFSPIYFSNLIITLNNITFNKGCTDIITAL